MRIREIGGTRYHVIKKTGDRGYTSSYVIKLFKIKQRVWCLLYNVYWIITTPKGELITTYTFSLPVQISSVMVWILASHLLSRLLASCCRTSLGCWYTILVNDQTSSLLNSVNSVNSVKWPCSPWVLVAQWVERPPGVREVMGSIPVNFSLSHARVMLINSPSHFITELKIHHLY